MARSILRDDQLTGAEQADVGQASALLAMAADAQAVIAPRQAQDTADKSDDSAALVQQIEANSAEAIVPPRSNRSSPRDYDHHRYQARNFVEQFFNQLKPFRRIATRYEKLAAHFAAMVTCRGIVLWLK